MIKFLAYTLIKICNGIITTGRTERTEQYFILNSGHTNDISMVHVEIRIRAVQTSTRT